MKDVSVIIPVYNGEKYIEKCILSIINQKNLKEIIIVDDGSTDNSKRVIENYQEKYINIKYYYQKNQGQGAARNNGIKKATGKYFMCVDCDDFLNKNTIETAYKIMKKNELDILYWNINWIVNSQIKKQPIFSKVYKKEDTKGYLLSDPSPCNKMFKTNLFIKNKIEFPTNIYYEDFALIPSLVKYTNKIMYTSQITYNYVQNENSVMHQNKYNKKIMDLVKAFNILYNSLRPNYYEELEYLAINQLIYFRTVELLKYNRRKEIKYIVNYVNNNFPNWRKNKYYKKRPKALKVYCNCIASQNLILAKFLCKIKNIIRK